MSEILKAFLGRLRIPKKSSQAPPQTPESPRVDEILRGENESTRDDYLNSLSSIDRTHVEELLQCFESWAQTKLPDLGLAVLAVGSTVKPPELRVHPPRNINMRVLISIPAVPENQIMKALTAGEILRGIEMFAKERKLENYPDDRNTAYFEWGKGIGSSSEEPVGYSTWEYGNPSIAIRYQEGLQIQIAIAGDKANDMVTHLRGERTSNNYFAILYPKPVHPRPAPDAV